MELSFLNHLGFFLLGIIVMYLKWIYMPKRNSYHWLIPFWSSIIIFIIAELVYLSLRLIFN